MSAPVITSVEVVYPAGGSSLGPGQTAEIHVDALDADNYVIEVALKVRSTSGDGEATGSAQVVVADGLLYSGTADQGTVTQDPTRPHVFFVTAPA